MAPSPAAQHPLAPGASSSAGSPERGQKAGKAEEPCFAGEHGITTYGKHFLLLSVCMEPCSPHTLLRGLPAGRARIYPLRALKEATQQVSSGARIRAETLLAPHPLHDSELVSEARGLGKVSFVYLESSMFCFPFKAQEPHDDSRCMQKCACMLNLSAEQRNACQ